MMRRMLIVLVLLMAVAKVWAQSGVSMRGVVIDRQYVASISWTPPVPATGLIYHVYRAGVQIGSTSDSSYRDRNVKHGGIYSYTVRSYDPNSGVESIDSLAITVTIP